MAEMWMRDGGPGPKPRKVLVRQLRLHQMNMHMILLRGLECQDSACNVNTTRRHCLDIHRHCEVETALNCA
jgi:hypothetical protein